MAVIQSHPGVANAAASAPFTLAGSAAENGAEGAFDALFTQLVQQIQAQLQRTSAEGGTLPLDGESLPPGMIRADLRAELEARLGDGADDGASLTEAQLDALVEQALERLRQLDDEYPMPSTARAAADFPFVLSPSDSGSAREENAPQAVLPEQWGEDRRREGADNPAAGARDGENPLVSALPVDERAAEAGAANAATATPDAGRPQRAQVEGAVREPVFVREAAERNVAVSAQARAERRGGGSSEWVVSPQLSGVADPARESLAAAAATVGEPAAAERPLAGVSGAEATLVSAAATASGVSLKGSGLGGEGEPVGRLASEGASAERRAASELPVTDAERRELASAERREPAAQLSAGDRGDPDPALPRQEAASRMEGSLAAAYAKILAGVSADKNASPALSPPAPGQLQSLYQVPTPQSPVLALPQRFGSEGWLPAASQRITWMASQQLGTAELRLDPPELGALQVRLSLHQDQASLTFTSPNPQVREALEQQMPRLREMLAENGINLQQSDVSDQGAGRSAPQDGNGRRGGAGELSDEAVDGPVATPRQQLLSLVDAYA